MARSHFPRALAPHFAAILSAAGPGTPYPEETRDSGQVIELARQGYAAEEIARFLDRKDGPSPPPRTPRPPATPPPTPRRGGSARPRITIRRKRTP